MGIVFMLQIYEWVLLSYLREYMNGGVFQIRAAQMYSILPLSQQPCFAVTDVSRSGSVYFLRLFHTISSF